uniref:Uncharacterized protein n=1 Tax=Timema genevievae TaxID=629358 RepID=A0A7R9JNY5_TIMGE|nr:unnamed protein product [Timema genevievae]
MYDFNSFRDEKEETEYAREPCPWRIVDDCGGAFTMGCIGGAVFQSIKARNGLPAMAGSALIGGVLLALIEGVGILFTRLSAEQFKPANPILEDPSQLGPPPQAQHY